MQLRPMIILSLTLSAACADLDPSAQNDDSTASEGDDEGTVPRASSSDTMAACKWELDYGTGTSLLAPCETAQRPIHGGCRAGWTGSDYVHVTDSHPYEGSSASDVPEDNEFWYQVSGTAGWRCGFDASGTAGSGLNYVYALCCGT